MNTGPLSLAPTVERLRAELPGDWTIGGAADLESAQKAKAPRTPACYVLLANDRPREPTSAAGRFIQPVTGSWGVVTAVRDYRSSERGAGESEELIVRIAQVRAALLGWKHPDGNGTTSRLGGPGRVLAFQDGVLWWQDIFAAEYHIR